MTVKQLKKELENYSETAEVKIVDFENGAEFDFSIGGDDEDEGTKYCRIGITTGS